VVALYAPQTSTACDALGRYLEAAGVRTSIELDHPVSAASKLRHGVLPYACYLMALRNGKEPSREVAEAAVQDACVKMKTRFGDAAVELNGAPISSIPRTPADAD
jgi:hypothetical protein